MVFHLLLPDFFVRDLAILGPQGVWGLILSLFGRDRRLVSRIPSRRGLELSHSNMSGTIIWWATPIHSSEDVGGWRLSIDE